MKRLILKSKSEPVEIHILGDDAISHSIDKVETTGPFLGIYLDDPLNWMKHEIKPAIFEHKYDDGSEIRLGDEVEIQIAKKTKRRGTIKFEQSAYGFEAFEAGMNRFTPLCCFSDSVSFRKL